MFLNSGIASFSSYRTEAVIVPLPLSMTVTTAVCSVVSYVTPARLPLTSVIVYVYVPGNVYSIASNATLPSTSFGFVCSTVPSASLSSKLNSPALRVLPVRIFLASSGSDVLSTLYSFVNVSGSFSVESAVAVSLPFSSATTDTVTVLPVVAALSLVTFGYVPVSVTL